MTLQEVMQLVEEYGTKRLIFTFNLHKVWASDEPCEIRRMDDFNDYNWDLGISPWEIAANAFYGDFNPNDRYFTIDGYGGYKSLCRRYND